MIADLRPYAECKESLVSWFGDVPGHWELKRLGSVFAERSETNEKYEVAEVLSVLKDIGVILYSEKGRVGNKKSEDIGRYKIVRPDDLVVNCMNVIIGSVGRSRYTGCLSPVYYVLKRRQPENLPRYLELVFQHKSFQRSLVRIGNGILAHRMRIPMERLKAELIPLPPPDEQAAIVRFLDWANGRLERAIRAKRKVIALLNEQKQAIIHRAVTRGLDPNVPLKSSGVPWIGDVPAHWPLAPNRTFLRIRKVLVGLHHPGFQLLSLTKGGVIVRNMADGGKHSNFWERSQEVRPGDLVFCLFDVDETPRTVGLSRHRGMISGDYTVMECSDAVNASYVECLYKAMDDRKLLSPLYSGLRKRIPKPEFLAAVAPIPPLEEQAAIVAMIEETLLSIERTAERIRREVSLLTEYRTRLVADVVTGKLDVREASARLPEEAPLGDIVGATEFDDETDDIEDEALAE